MQSNSPSSQRRTFKYRLYPTRLQAATLDAQIDEACALYNAALQERRDAWKLAHHTVTFFDQDRQLKEIRAAGNLAIPNFSISRDVLRRVDRAFVAFFRRHKAGVKVGYPRFKARSRYHSLTFTTYGKGCQLRATGYLYAQGIGHLKLKLHRAIQGDIKTVSIKREAGHWYVMFSCVVESHPLPSSDENVGVDLGLTDFATLSDGQVIANPRYFRAAQRTLRVAQRRVARRQKGSNGRRKAVRLLQNANLHVEHQRTDFHHKTARALVDRYGLIAVEDLNVHGLAASRLAKSVHDAGWASFLAKLDYKAASAGRKLIRVNPNGTTQRCNGCQTVVPKTLKQRWHSCPSCGLNCSRDENAAREILRLGKSHAEQTWSGATSVSAEVV